eukprot:3677483-Pleurochrysis_carterae.AAC.1
MSLATRLVAPEPGKTRAMVRARELHTHRSRSALEMTVRLHDAVDAASVFSKSYRRTRNARLPIEDASCLANLDSFSR